MRKLGQTERDILSVLRERDPDGKKGVVRLLSHFEYRGHLCLVFEALAMNLRELTKRTKVLFPVIATFKRFATCNCSHWCPVFETLVMNLSSHR